MRAGILRAARPPSSQHRQSRMPLRSDLRTGSRDHAAPATRRNATVYTYLPTRKNLCVARRYAGRDRASEPPARVAPGSRRRVLDRRAGRGACRLSHQDASRHAVLRFPPALTPKCSNQELEERQEMHPWRRQVAPTQVHPHRHLRLRLRFRSRSRSQASCVDPPCCYHPSTSAGVLCAPFPAGAPAAGRRLAGGHMTPGEAQHDHHARTSMSSV